MSEWGKDLNNHLLTFLMAVVLRERRREGTEDFTPLGDMQPCLKTLGKYAGWQ